MSVSTLQPKKSSPLKKILPILIVLVGVGLFIYFGRGIIDRVINLGGSTELSVNSQFVEAEVLLDDELLGTTPFESSEIKPGDRKVTVQNDSNIYETTLNFLSSTEVVINRDLGISPTFSSGQNFWLEEKEDSVLVVISDPEGAKVYIDNTEVGTTPYPTSSLTEGEYDLRIERAGYEPQSARIQVFEDHTLNVAFTLFPLPVPSRVSLLDGSSTLYDLASNDPVVTSDTNQWAQAIVYWNQTRGVNLAGSGVNKEPVFDFLLDYKGGLFDRNGDPVLSPATFELPDGALGGYMGRASDGAGVTPEAQDTLESLDVSAAQTVTILETGTGWLRVRSEPSLDGDEIDRVDVGESYVLLAEQEGWVQIQLDDSTTGWVSSTYVEINTGAVEGTSDTTEAAEETSTTASEDSTEDTQDESEE